ncbi:MAG: hypothetical protein K1X53_03545 [Candidatus Sumerlaeaceae bacterium]|nr:hypothetical protein [Candidatus Sumerlaeaceae bacterium]
MDNLANCSLSARMRQPPRWHYAVMVAWALICAGLLVRMAVQTNFTLGPEEDIRYIFQEGQGILRGENPYARITAGNMERNHKYATYLPGIYLLAAGFEAMGLGDFDRWLLVWRGVSVVFWAGIGVLVFALVYGPRGRLATALLASGLWLFNRWSLHVLVIAHTDFVALFFFVLCVMLLERWPRWAWLALGVSLSIKHIAILAVPVLLVAQWQGTPPERRRGAMAWAVGAMAAVPLVVSLPYLIAAPYAFVKTMLFSFTRDAMVHYHLLSVDVALDWEDHLSRIPMLLAVGTATWLVARRQVGLVAGVFLVMAGFVWFNSVFFLQYIVWAIPFALVMALTEREEKKTT